MPHNVKLPSTDEAILFLRYSLGDRVKREERSKNCHYIFHLKDSSNAPSVTLNDNEIPLRTWRNILLAAGIPYKEWVALAGTKKLFKKWLKDAKRRAEGRAE